MADDPWADFRTESSAPADPWAAFRTQEAAPQAAPAPQLAPQQAPGVGPPQEPSPITAGGIAKQAGIGALKGGIGIGTMGGDLRELIAGGLGKVTGGSPETASNLLRAAPFLGGPTSQQVQGGIENLTGEFRKPQNTAEEYAQTAGEFLPAALGGAGGVVRRGAQVLAPAIASETAGQLTKGTGAEPYARAGAAIATPFAGAVARRVVTPLPMPAARAPAVEALRNEGVDLTAGQSTGSKPLQWFESALGDIPGAGRGAATASERQAEQFTAATLRRAGVNAPRATPEVIDHAFTRIGNQFDALAARNTWQPDAQFGREMRRGIDEYRDLVSPPNRAPIIENFETEIATQMARHGGAIPGATFQSLSSRLSAAARGAPPEVSHTLRDMQNAFNAAMERNLAVNHSPDFGAWREVRNQYRNMLTIERAATGAGENAALGLITPSALRNATVAMGRRAYGRGQGDFAELARSGEAAMKPLPQSGTAPRSYAQAIPGVVGGTLGAMFAGAPGAALGGAAALAGPPLMGRALMSRPVQGYLGNQLLPGRGNPLPRGILGGLLSQPQGILPTRQE